MAFTTRSDRRTEFFSPKTTSEVVGPGSYSLPKEQRVIHGYAPFSSTAERKVSSGSLVTPGPGSYDTSSYKPYSSPPPATLNQTAPRWKADKGDDKPGPGAYDLPTTFKLKKRPRSANAQHKTNVVWFRAPTAPSIPIPAQAHGYEETPNGELVPQKPPVRGYTGRGGDSVGPGGYDVIESIHRVHKSKGTDFGKSRAQRSGWTAGGSKESEKESLPGPGQYDWATTVEPPPRMKRPTATFVSRVLRAHEKPQHEEEEGPGPGSYDAHLYHAIKPKVVPEVLQCFGSTSRRTIDSPERALGPGPGSYNSKNIAPWEIGKRKPLFDANRAPFASSTSRFAKVGGGGLEEDPPGPGQYTKPDFISELQKTKFGRGGHFGSTSRRFDSGKKDDDEEEPGPGAYEFKQPKFIAGTLRKGPSSVFASSSERFEKIRKEKEIRPAPGQYQIANDLVKKPYRGSKSASFTSSSERFKQKLPAAEEPGPGQYSGAVGSIEHRLATLPERPAGFGSERRFKNMEKKLPVGPGQYDPVDPYGGLIKRSFNVTIESGFL